MSQTVVCVATFIANQGEAASLHQALQALVEPTRSEAGCQSYVLHQGIDNPGLFTMIEHFEDMAAFELHSSQPYLESFKAQCGEWVESVSVNLHRIADPTSA
ncbi:putative quinol monooxygenase [Dongshaea marina]|uniref:putative quinol monooxygenase n=1 Tax=Dongshaea marina TaxID=2047966 RepID=UPI000D3E6FED|nr:putative quinol monooxygenase [Dongshaea marina]